MKIGKKIAVLVFLIAGFCFVNYQKVEANSSAYISCPSHYVEGGAVCIFQYQDPQPCECTYECTYPDSQTREYYRNLEPFEVNICNYL